jgi:hypothetical protein
VCLTFDFYRKEVKAITHFLVCQGVYYRNNMFTNFKDKLLLLVSLNFPNADSEELYITNKLSPSILDHQYKHMFIIECKVQANFCNRILTFFLQSVHTTSLRSKPHFFLSQGRLLRLEQEITGHKREAPSWALLRSSSTQA